MPNRDDDLPPLSREERDALTRRASRKVNPPPMFGAGVVLRYDRDLERAEERIEQMEGQRASECDLLNTELRENNRALDQVRDWNADIRPAIKALVDGARAAERFQVRERIAALERAEQNLESARDMLGKQGLERADLLERIAALEGALQQVREWRQRAETVGDLLRMMRDEPEALEAALRRPGEEGG